MRPVLFDRGCIFSVHPSPYRALKKAGQVRAAPTSPTANPALRRRWEAQRPERRGHARHARARPRDQQLPLRLRRPELNRHRDPPRPDAPADQRPLAHHYRAAEQLRPAPGERGGDDRRGERGDRDPPRVCMRRHPPRDEAARASAHGRPDDGRERRRRRDHGEPPTAMDDKAHGTARAGDPAAPPPAAAGRPRSPAGRRSARSLRHSATRAGEERAESAAPPTMNRWSTAGSGEGWARGYNGKTARNSTASGRPSGAARRHGEGRAGYRRWARPIARARGMGATRAGQSERGRPAGEGDYFRGGCEEKSEQRARSFRAIRSYVGCRC